MPSKKVPQIFIAHANEDKPQVRELYARLKQSGFKPWLDEKDLLPGQNWRDEIPNALRNSDFFIACLSSRSVSKRGYIQREFRQAINLLAEMPTGTIYLIPLKLNQCEIPDLRQNEYGVNLRDIQWLNYDEEEGYQRLVTAINYQWEKPGHEAIETNPDSSPSNPSGTAQQNTFEAPVGISGGQGSISVSGNGKVAGVINEYNYSTTPLATEGGDALELWREKLKDYQREEAITSDPEKKFQLKQLIKECQSKIQSLGG